jgi:hypothetical protein
MKALAILVLALIVAPAARAGGDFLDLAVGGGRVWVVGPPGVREFDAAGGGSVATRRLGGAAYPLSVALAGGAAWVASVENGFVWGTLTRIDERTGRVRVVWREQNSSVQYVAAGVGGVWALIGSSRTMRVALFSLRGRLLRIWQVAGAGRIAADADGCWLSASGRLLHIDRAGRLHRVRAAPFGDVATGGGAVWLAGSASVLRIDERTGRTRTIATGPLALGGFQHDLGVGDSSLWVLQHRVIQHRGAMSSALLRFDPLSGRLTGTAALPGVADALVVRPNAVWVATVISPAGRSATGYDLVRIDPQTLRRTLLVHVI